MGCQGARRYDQVLCKSTFKDQAHRLMKLPLEVITHKDIKKGVQAAVENCHATGQCNTPIHERFESVVDCYHVTIIVYELEHVEWQPAYEESQDDCKDDAERPWPYSLPMEASGAHSYGDIRPDDDYERDEESQYKT